MKRNRSKNVPSSPEAEAGTVRERTLSHMESLLRTAATVGTGIALACGAKAQSTGPQQVVDPLPPPVGCTVDPEQFLLRGCLEQQAHWVKSGMRWTIQLDITANPGRTEVSFEGLKSPDIKPVGVSIKDVKVDPRKLSLVLTVGATSRNANLQFPVLCNDKKIPVKLLLDLSKAPVEKGEVLVRLTK